MLLLAYKLYTDCVMYCNAYYIYVHIMFGMANRLYTIAYSHTEKVNMTAAVKKKNIQLCVSYARRTVTVYT